jgi:hypothetical protein
VDLLGSSLAAALLDDIFEQPAGYFSVVPDVQANEDLACQRSFPHKLLAVH